MREKGVEDGRVRNTRGCECLMKMRLTLVPFIALTCTTLLCGFSMHTLPYGCGEESHYLVSIAE